MCEQQTNQSQFVCVKMNIILEVHGSAHVMYFMGKKEEK